MDLLMKILEGISRKAAREILERLKESDPEVKKILEEAEA